MAGPGVASHEVKHQLQPLWRQGSSMPRWREEEGRRSGDRAPSRGPQTERPVYRRDTRYVGNPYGLVQGRGWVERKPPLWASVQRHLFWGPHQRTRACAGLLSAGAQELVTKESRRAVEQAS